MVLGRGRKSGLALALGAFVAPTVLYVWRARAFPDQLWVMRRFLPLTIPGVALACFAVLGMMWRTRDVVLRAIALAVGAAAVVVPAIALQPVWRTSTQRGMDAAVDAMCAAVGDDAAVVVLQDENLDQLLPQTIRSWCDVPAAGALPGFDRATAVALDAQWAQSGRRLYIIGTNPETVQPLATILRDDIGAANDRELEQTLTRRPSHLISFPFQFVVGRVSAGG